MTHSPYALAVLVLSVACHSPTAPIETACLAVRVLVADSTATDTTMIRRDAPCPQ